LTEFVLDEWPMATIADRLAATADFSPDKKLLKAVKLVIQALDRGCELAATHLSTRGDSKSTNPSLSQAVASVCGLNGLAEQHVAALLLR